MPDKVLVSNNAALVAKYGSDKTRIDAAIANLIAADQQRGLQTVMIAVDDAAAMAGVNGQPVAGPTDEPGNKAAIDAIYSSSTPDYLVLIGGPDIIPHQTLMNPVQDPADPDQTVPSDLPYACDGGFSNDAGEFVGPTRVVSRIPDVTGSSDSTYLTKLLRFSAQSQSSPVSAFANWLGVTAKEWSISTQMSLQAVFGNASSMSISPPDGPNWSVNQLQTLAHFFNCHGSPNDHRFFGQDGTSFPTAHDASVVAGNIRPGNVLAAECCYGAQLYDPTRDGGQMCMANTYLADGASAYLGSTTIAYGPANANANADLVCQFFLQEVLKGASVGLSLLRARQRYVQSNTNMGVTDLKTLAQFLVLGDASTYCVLAPTPAAQATAKFAFAAVPGIAGVVDEARGQRRQAAAEMGAFLKASRTVASRRKDAGGLPESVQELLQASGFENPSVASYAVRPGSLRPHTRGVAPEVMGFHLIFDGSANRGPYGAARRVLEVQTSNGTILNMKELYTR